jgi:dihydroorotate dehydrogenase
LEKLLTELKKVPSAKPVYVKLPINLSWEQIEKLLVITISLKYQGVVIGNLNKNYDALDCKEDAPNEFRGGLSGKPCFELSNELIRKTKEKYGDKITIIGCGGVMSPQDAVLKQEMGSDLIELISGIIFEGPSLVKKMAKTYSGSRSLK